MGTMSNIPPSIGPLPEFALAADLPAVGNVGDQYLIRATGVIYFWDGSAWEPIDAQLAAAAVSDSDSVDHAVAAGVLSSAVRLSANAAASGYFKCTLTIKTTSSVGLHVELPIATASLTGALSSTDWSSFDGRVVANGAIAGATKCKITYDAKGLVTVGGDLASTDIPNLDAAKITSGTFDIARIPAAALERMVSVADQTARYALTTATVQNGDCVYQIDTALMYWVIDDTKLGQAAGYAVYAAGTAAACPWSGITSKPSWTAQQADSTHDGYLVMADWSTFNGKMSGTAKLTALTAETAGTASTAGQIGEELVLEVASPSATGVGATGAWGDVGFLDLTNGEWLIMATIGFDPNAATLTTALEGGCKATIGDSAPVLGRRIRLPFSLTGDEDTEIALPVFTVSVSGGTQRHYLKTKFTYSAGAPKHYGRMVARRVQ